MDRRAFLERTGALIALGSTPPLVGAAAAAGGYPSSAEIERMVTNIEKSIARIDGGDELLGDKQYCLSKGLSERFFKDLTHAALIAGAVHELPEKARTHASIQRLVRQHGPRVVHTTNSAADYLQGLNPKECEGIRHLLATEPQVTAPFFDAFAQRSEQMGVPKQRATAGAARMKEALWRLEHQPASLAIDHPAELLDRRYRSAGVDRSDWRRQVELYLVHHPSRPSLPTALQDRSTAHWSIIAGEVKPPRDGEDDANMEHAEKFVRIGMGTVLGGLGLTALGGAALVVSFAVVGSYELALLSCLPIFAGLATMVVGAAVVRVGKSRKRRIQEGTYP